MSFDVDALIGPPTPAPAERAAREPASAEPGESFEDHLADAAPADEPVAETRPRAEQSEKSEGAPALTPEPTAAPAPPQTPAPILVQVIASAPATAVVEANTEATPQAAPVARTPDAPAPTTPVAPVVAKPKAQAAPVDAEATTDTGEPAPTTPTADVKPAATKFAPAATPQQNTQQQTANPETQTATPTTQQQAAPVEALTQVAPTPVVPVVTQPTGEKREAGAIDPNAARAGDTKALPDAPVKEPNAAQPQPNAPKAAPQSGAAKENFATLLAAQDAPDTGGPVQQAQPTTPASATSTTTSAQPVQDAAAAARAAPAAMQVGREIVRRFSGESTRFELRLDPPELGRVEIRLDVSRDHRVTAVIAADSPAALAELSRHARDLEQALQSAGLQLDENGLSFDLNRGGEQRAEAEQTRGGAGASAEANGTQDTPAPSARPIGLERWRGVRVDVMA